MICHDTDLGYKQSNKLIVLQIFQQERDTETKQAFYAELAKQLEEKCGLKGEDLIVMMCENGKEDWSF